MITKKDFSAFGCKKSMNWATYLKCNKCPLVFVNKLAFEDVAVFNRILKLKKNGK